MQSAATITELAESSGEGASHWSRAGGTTNTAAVAVENADEARPPGFAKHSASAESALASQCCPVMLDLQGPE